MLVFEKYVGSKLSTRDNYNISVSDILINDTGLTSTRVQVFHTNNRYNSMSLDKKMLVKHKCKLCGTITPTNKKYFQDNKIPFLRLSRGELREVKHVWFCEAVIEMKTPARKKIMYNAQYGVIRKSFFTFQ